MRTIACLPSLVGHWGRRGGGVLLSTSRAFSSTTVGSIDRTRADSSTADPQHDSTRGCAGRRHRRSRRAHYRPCQVTPVDDPGPGVAALVVYNANPAASTPDLARTRGLARADLFTVVSSISGQMGKLCRHHLASYDPGGALGRARLLRASLRLPDRPAEPVGETRSTPTSSARSGRLADRLGGTLATPGLFDDDDETLVRAS